MPSSYAIGCWTAATRPRGRALAILRSRAMRATLECMDAKRLLGWTPVSDRETFITKAIHVHRQDGTAA